MLGWLCPVSALCWARLRLASVVQVSERCPDWSGTTTLRDARGERQPLPLADEAIRHPRLRRCSGAKATSSGFLPTSCEGWGRPRAVSLVVGGCSGIFASQCGDRGPRADLPSHILAPAEVSQLPAPHPHTSHPDDKHSDSDCPRPSSPWPKSHM